MNSIETTGRMAIVRGMWTWLRLLPLPGLGIMLAAEPAEVDPWAEMKALRFDVALREFRGPGPEAGSGEQAYRRFGAALALLNLQPKTRQTIAAARQIFEELARSSPDDELGIRSRYYLGRIAQLHEYDPDWARAADCYVRLFDDHPDSPWAQLGIAKLALIRLYDASSADSPAVRHATLRGYGERLTFAPARRDFHYAMGVACLFFGLRDEDALGHLLASKDAGLVNDQNRGNVFIRIAEVAARLGQSRLAAENYGAFLAVAPRDVRTRYAREQREALLAKAEK